MPWSSSRGARRASRAIGVVAAFALALGAPHWSASAYDASSQNKALLILRILSYDHNLRMRAGERVTVLVLHHPYEESSLRAREELVGSLKKMQRVKVAGLPINVVSAAYADSRGFESRLAQTRPAAVIVCPGLEGDLGSISTVTRRASALTISTSEPDVRRGLSVAIVRRDGKDRIIINVPAARAEGARFDAGLLQLATIVGGTR
jgi:hypothetical protein